MAICTFALTLSAWGQAEVYLANARTRETSYARNSRIALLGGFGTTILASIALIAVGVPTWTALATTLWLPILSQANLWKSVNIASGELRLPAVNSALTQLLRMASYILFAALGAFNVVAAITITQAVAAFAAIVTVGWQARTTSRDSTIHVSWQALLRGGTAVIAFDTLNAIALRSDLIVLQIASSAEQVGLYAAPASLTTASLAVSLASRTRLQSILARGETLSRAKREIATVLALGLLAALTLWIIAPSLVPLLFGSEFLPAIAATQLLALAVPGFLMLDLAQGAIASLGGRRLLIAIGTISASTTLVALTIGTRQGATGTAASVAIAYTVCAAIAWLLLLRTQMIRFRAS